MDGGYCAVCWSVRRKFEYATLCVITRKALQVFKIDILYRWGVVGGRWAVSRGGAWIGVSRCRMICVWCFIVGAPKTSTGNLACASLLPSCPPPIASVYAKQNFPVAVELQRRKEQGRFPSHSHFYARYRYFLSLTTLYPLSLGNNYQKPTSPLDSHTTRSLTTSIYHTLRVKHLVGSARP